MCVYLLAGLLQELRDFRPVRAGPRIPLTEHHLGSQTKLDHLLMGENCCRRTAATLRSVRSRIVVALWLENPRKRLDCAQISFRTSVGHTQMPRYGVPQRVVGWS